MGRAAPLTPREQAFCISTGCGALAAADHALARATIAERRCARDAARWTLAVPALRPMVALRDAQATVGAEGTCTDLAPAPRRSRIYAAAIQPRRRSRWAASTSRSATRTAAAALGCCTRAASST